MRDDPHEIPPVTEPDPFWLLLLVTVISACVGIALFWLAVAGVL